LIFKGLDSNPRRASKTAAKPRRAEPKAQQGFFALGHWRDGNVAPKAGGAKKYYQGGPVETILRLFGAQVFLGE
jgi:hypothetical protein